MNRTNIEIDGHRVGWVYRVSASKWSAYLVADFAPSAPPAGQGYPLGNFTRRKDAEAEVEFWANRFKR